MVTKTTMSKSPMALLKDYVGWPTQPAMDFKQLKKFITQEERECKYRPSLPELDWLKEKIRYIINSTGVKNGLVIHLSAVKGGVGKSTTTFNFAAWLAKQGFKVAIVDVCENRSCKIWADRRKKDKTLPNVDVFTCNRNDDKDLETLVRELQGQYDFVLIDDTPGTGELTTASMMLADTIFVLTQAKLMDADTLRDMKAHYQLACDTVNNGEPIPIAVIINNDDTETKKATAKATKAQIMRLGLPRMYHRIISRTYYEQAWGLGCGICDRDFAITYAAEEFEAVAIEMLSVTVKNSYHE